jgi:DNA-binding NarL/FixJ family response regulator
MDIILVDDNRMFLQGLKLFIENKLNHEVVDVAHSGEEFLLLKHLADTDIILMDLMMGKLTGIEAAKAAFIDNPDLKIIAMSMNTDNRIKMRVREAGFRGMINKDEIFDSLEKVIELVCSGKTAF